MISYRLLCGLMLFLCIAGLTMASGESITLVSGVPTWLNATGKDNATFTIRYTDTIVSGQLIDLNVSSGSGKLNQTTITTNGDGYASFIFTSGTVSGNATIRATYRNNTATNLNITQLIDHGAPNQIRPVYDDPVTVGSNVTISLQVLDRYNNPVDNRREIYEGRTPELIHFVLSSPGNLGIFNGTWEGIAYNGTEIFNTTHGLPVNATGYILLNLIMSSIPGDSIIYVDPIFGLSDKYLRIEGIALGIPAAMDQLVNPTVLYQPAGINSTFSITYTLFDEYGNRLNGKDIQVETTLGEHYNLTTNVEGEATMTYGPKTTPQVITLTAHPVENPLLVHSSTVEFYDTSPVLLSLTALPDILPSLDLAPNVNATVKAKVTDIKGVPKSGETVQFTIMPRATLPPSETIAPYFETFGTTTKSDVTDGDGFASVFFMPGTFKGPEETGFDQLAQGNCTVKAEWNGKTEYKNISWFHKPYISVFTSLSATNVSINQTVDVTIQVKGVGYQASVREPLDAILTTSRARSMTKEYPDRMVFAHLAEQRFIDKLTQIPPSSGADQVGLLSMGGNPNGVADILLTYEGWSKGDAGIDGNEADDAAYMLANYPGQRNIIYRDFVTWEQLPTSNMATLRSKINYTTPSSSNDKNANQNEMPLRRAVYEAIMQLRTTPNQNKYIVLLVDSEITDYGDVLAEGNPNQNWKKMNGCTQKYYPFGGPNNTWSNKDPNQDMRVFARNSNVTIYVIYAAGQLNNCDRSTLTRLAEGTGGAFNETADASQLISIYDWVAGKIITEAAKDISMTINMGTLEVNGQWIAYDPNDPVNTSVFDYVYMPNQSTLIRRYYESNSTEIPGTRTTINQTDEYNADRILHFNIGTLMFDQVWEATYRLKALMAGNINIFGENTTMVFNTTETIYTIPIPEDWITVPEIFTPARNETRILKIESFIVPHESKNYVLISWNISYTYLNLTPAPTDSIITNIYYRDLNYLPVRLTTSPKNTSGIYRVPTSLLHTGRVNFIIESMDPLAAKVTDTNWTYISLGPSPKPTGLGGEESPSICIWGFPCIKLQ